MVLYFSVNCNHCDHCTVFHCSGDISACKQWLLLVIGYFLLQSILVIVGSKVLRLYCVVLRNGLTFQDMSVDLSIYVPVIISTRLFRSGFTKGDSRVIVDLVL